MSPIDSCWPKRLRDAACMVTREPVDGLSLVIARNVRSRRAALKLRQVDVAERAGIPRSMLSTIEGERRRVTLDDALALCRGLETTLLALVEGAPAADRRTLGI
jgi:transcriptional regulator with XRE-family HTH domain